MLRRLVLATTIALSLLLPFLVSCGGPHLYVNEEADFAFYERVGVMPFSNFSNDRNASDKVTTSFTNELLMLRTVSVALEGDFGRAVDTLLKRDIVNAMEELTSAEIASLGQATGVEGIFVGSVKDFGMVRAGQEEFPLIAVVVRLLDCQSGRVVWSYEVSRRGGPKFPIFSFGETHTLGEMTTKVCREVAESFGKLMR